MLGNLWRKWRQRRWWIRWIVYGVTPIVLFYGVEDLRGWWAWKKYRETWEAAGDRFEIENYLPEPVPVEQNFAATPFIEELYRNEGEFDEPFEVTEFVWKLPADEKAPRRFRGLCRVYPFETLYEKGRFDRESAAREILRELAAWDPLIEELSEAAARPHCDYPIDLEQDGWISSSHHTMAFIRIAAALKIRSLARLKTGDSIGALSDIELILELNRHTTSEGMLIAALVAQALYGAILDPIWDGLRRHSWTDAELKELQQKLTRIDHRERMTQCYFRERGVQLRETERLARNVFYRYETVDQLKNYVGAPQFLIPKDPAGMEGIDPFLSSIAAVIAPRGWYWQNKVSICRAYEEALGKRPWDPNFRPPSLRSTPFNPSPETPYNFVVVQIVPTMTNMVERASERQLAFDLLVAAIAAERFRISSGDYPDSIEELVPDFLDKILIDPYSKTQESVRIQRRDDGTIAIYSIGRNGIDEGGRPHRSEDKGDRVWHYSLPPGFTVDDFID